MPTKIINNFTGRLTRNNIGEMNSGYAKYTTTFGTDPFSDISNLSWLEQPVQIDSAGSVITDLIVAAKTRLESGVTYVYGIGHTGRLYKIQSNDPAGYNPNLDTAVLIATLTSNSPTFKYGTSMTFYGSTERIYIGHDIGFTMVNFDGTGETFIGSAGSYDPNVPRPAAIFAGVIYFGNNRKIGTIDTTNTVTSYSAMSPALPTGVQCRDIDVSPDGNYLQIIGSRIPAQDITTTTQDTTSLSSAESYRILWNGLSGTGATSYTSYNSYSMTTNTSFGEQNFTMGYDMGGAAIYSGAKKIITLPNSISSNFNSFFSTGNLLGFASPESNSGFLKTNLMFYGQYDHEVPEGLFRFLRYAAQGAQTDVLQVPVCLIVSNLFYGASSAGYAGNQVGAAKIYFSTLETSSAPTTKYKLYKFTTVPTGLGTAIGGVYETQNETSFSLFRSVVSKKFKPTNIRFYTSPLVTNNSFQIDLIGADGNPLSGGTQTFTVGSNVTANNDFVWYTPQTAPTYSIGARITNLGSVNWTGVKLEMDYEEYGK